MSRSHSNLPFEVGGGVALVKEAIRPMLNHAKPEVSNGSEGMRYSPRLLRGPAAYPLIFFRDTKADRPP